MVLPVDLPQLQLVVLWSTNMEICKPEKQHQKTFFIALKRIAREFAKLKKHQQFNLKIGSLQLLFIKTSFVWKSSTGVFWLTVKWRRVDPVEVIGFSWKKSIFVNKTNCKRVSYLHQSVNFFHGRKFYFFWIFLRHLRRSIFCFPTSFEILTISLY